jgi:hypothetical protein
VNTNRAPIAGEVQSLPVAALLFVAIVRTVFRRRNDR